MNNVKDECYNCNGKGKHWCDLGGPCGRNISCEICNGTGYVYITIEFALQKLERMKSGLFLYLEEILKLQKAVQNVGKD